MGQAYLSEMWWFDGVYRRERVLDIVLKNFFARDGQPFFAKKIVYLHRKSKIVVRLSCQK
jgi:hypothetical protein